MAWSDISVTLSGISGDSLTLSASNPRGAAEVARVGVGVRLADGTETRLESENVTFGAGQTKSVRLTASSTIDTTTDSPEPLPPT